MRAWLLTAQEGLSTMVLGEIERPRAGAGEVVLRVKYAALNPADRYLAEGQYPGKVVFPHILGRDGMGDVVEVGEGVQGVNVGDVRVVLRSEVGVTRRGTLAEYVAVPAESVAEVPRGWSEEEAAAGPLVYLTAWQALRQWGEVKAGSVVLITGATGGVGVASVQLAKAMGCFVIGMSRSEEKGKRLRELGADEVVSPEDGEWGKKVKEKLAGRRVDLAIDNVGGTLFSEVINVLGEWGKVSVVGRLAGVVPEFNTATLFFRRIRIGGVAVGTYTAEESREAWREIVRMMGNARPVVDGVWEFGEVMGAFGRLAEGPMGKVVVRVA